MSVKRIRVTKNPLPQPMLRLVRGDANTQVLRFLVNKDYGGKDLTGLVWSVWVQGYRGEAEVSYIGKGVVDGDDIVLDWEVIPAVTKDAGITVLKLYGSNSGAAEKEYAWVSGNMQIAVTPTQCIDPCYDEDEVREVRQLIEDFDNKFGAHKTAIDDKIADQSAHVEELFEEQNEHIEELIEAEQTTRRNMDNALTEAQELMTERMDTFTSLPSGGTVEQATINDIRTEIRSVGDRVTNTETMLDDYNCIDLLNAYCNPKSLTIRGVTFTVNADKSITAVGTASTGTNVDDACIYYYNNRLALAPWLEPGKSYRLVYAGVPNIRVTIYFYKDNVYMSGGQNYTGSAIINVPADANGAMLRLSVTKGATVDATVRPVLMNSYSNSEINAKVDAVAAQANTLSGNVTAKLDAAYADLNAITDKHSPVVRINGLSDGSGNLMDPARTDRAYCTMYLGAKAVSVQMTDDTYQYKLFFYKGRTRSAIEKSSAFTGEKTGWFDGTKKTFVYRKDYTSIGINFLKKSDESANLTESLDDIRSKLVITRYDDGKVPTLTEEQKEQIVALANEYLSNKDSFYYATGHTRNDYYSGDTTFNKSAGSKNYGRAKLNCNTLCQNIWMGRNVSDYVGHTADNYSNRITKAFNWGYYIYYGMRRKVGGFAFRKYDQNGNRYIYDYYNFVAPNLVIYDNDHNNGDYTGSYSDTTYYQKAATSRPFNQAFIQYMSANDIAKELSEYGYEIPVSEIDIGDMVFSSPTGKSRNADNDFFYENVCWRNISHAMICIGFDSNDYPIFIESRSSTTINTLQSDSENIQERMDWLRRYRNIKAVVRHPAAWGDNNMTSTYNTEIGWIKLASTTHDEQERNEEIDSDLKD